MWHCAPAWLRNTRPGEFPLQEPAGTFTLVAKAEWRKAMLQPKTANIGHWAERVDLAAAFRWTARLNMHEAVANHFSLAVSEDGTRFLMNPNQVHFSRIRASGLLLLDANDPAAMDTPDAPDPTAWGLHGSIHRLVPHARCVMHVHSIHATVLACLKDSTLPPIDQNTAMFYGRTVIDEDFGGLAFEEEGTRCAGMLADPKVKVMIMGNHGVLVIGSDVADAFNRLFYFERAAETYIRALQTGQELRVLPHDIAEKTAREIEDYPGQAEAHMRELKAILDEEGCNYAS
jgi:ribulose-5-phosphate 4-epimerase/fuculose-1-phosphate aldolase